MMSKHIVSSIDYFGFDELILKAKCEIQSWFREDYCINWIITSEHFAQFGNRKIKLTDMYDYAFSRNVFLLFFLFSVSFKPENFKLLEIINIKSRLLIKSNFFFYTLS